MKQFKIFDLWLSTILISGSFIYPLFRHDVTIFIGYFVVGGWQVISMLAHFINRWFCGNGSKRYNYQWTVLILTFLTALGWSFNLLLLLYVMLFILLLISPVMAIYYTWLCYQEVYVKMQRPLALLK